MPADEAKTLREPESGAHFTRVGQALGVGLHLSGDTRAPLVLDAPLSWTNPRNQGLILEALSGAACPHVVVAAHQCQIDELAVALWERLNRIHLVEGSWEVRTSLLSEPVVEGRAD